MRLFISYRRQDSAAYTGRLSDALAARYGPGSVYLDFANIAPGEDFRSHVQDALSRCDTVLAVIGPVWLRAASRDGERRMDDPDDFVRSELRSALALGKALVPVLVGGADVPARDQLPEDISAIADLEAIRLGDATWTRDVSLLTKRLDGNGRSGWTRWLPWKN